MSKKLIINADDFGMSEAFSLGVIKGFREGVVSSVSIMVNLPASEHAAKLAKENPDMFVGLHTNLVLGKPCSNPDEIPSLVDEKGMFLGSKEYKTGERAFVYEDVKKETVAQMQRFEELLGYAPQHIEGHSAMDIHVGKAFYDIAVEKGIHASMFVGAADVENLTDYYPVRMSENNMLVLDPGVSVENFTNDFFNILSNPSDDAIELHFHPGYVDQFIINHSTLVLPRCRDLATCLDSRVKDWIMKNKIELINFGDLKK
ncbi:ChbG/HpnK family deacetylase [Enterococcus sp. LJL120]